MLLQNFPRHLRQVLNINRVPQIFRVVCRLHQVLSGYRARYILFGVFPSLSVPDRGSRFGGNFRGVGLQRGACCQGGDPDALRSVGSVWGAVGLLVVRKVLLLGGVAMETLFSGEVPRICSFQVVFVYLLVEVLYEMLVAFDQISKLLQLRSFVRAFLAYPNNLFVLFAHASLE